MERTKIIGHWFKLLPDDCNPEQFGACITFEYSKEFNYFLVGMIQKLSDESSFPFTTFNPFYKKYNLPKYIYPTNCISTIKKSKSGGVFISIDGYEKIFLVMYSDTEKELQQLIIEQQKIVDFIFDEYHKNETKYYEKMFEKIDEPKDKIDEVKYEPPKEQEYGFNNVTYDYISKNFGK